MWSWVRRLNGCSVLVLGTTLSTILVFIKLIFSLAGLSWWVVLLPYLISILLVSLGLIYSAGGLKEFLLSIVYSFIIILLFIFALGFMLVDSIVKLVHEKFIK